jgi:hypothetical protein
LSDDQAEQRTLLWWPFRVRRTFMFTDTAGRLSAAVLTAKRLKVTTAGTD